MHESFTVLVAGDCENLIYDSHHPHNICAANLGLGDRAKVFAWLTKEDRFKCYAGGIVAGINSRDGCISR